MRIELINTGSELMLGRVLNTHQQWICRELADRGYLVNLQVSVPDTAPDIEAAVRDALARADLVITTGGLGPTSDDLTRDLIARLLQRELHEDAGVLAKITAYFESRKRPMPASTKVQALVPAGALVLPNPNGTAPGLAMEYVPNAFRSGGERSWLVMLPGPPRELRPMFIDAVMPLLHRVLPPAATFTCHTLRSTGIGESVVEERVGPLLEDFTRQGLELGYCARPGQVDVRLAASGARGKELVDQAEAIVRSQLGEAIYGEEGEELEAKLVELLTDRKETLAVAESCTGGYITHRITNVPGASAILQAGIATYSNETKQALLGVKAETLLKHGAVSKAVAAQMAEGALQRTGATYALATTGIAGPSGGTTTKPVGTVFIGLAGPFPTTVHHFVNSLDRLTFKDLTAQQAMDLLRRTIQKRARRF